MSDDDDDPPVKKDNRLLAIGLAILAAGCLIYASFTRHWLANSGDQVSVDFGLREVALCGADYQAARIEALIGKPLAGECLVQSNDDLVSELRTMRAYDRDAPSGVFVPIGWATFVECLLAATGLLVAAGLALARKRPQLPLAPTTVALLGIMTALITGCLFVATKPAVVSAGVGISFWVFGAGAVAGIAGAQLLAKVNRPDDPDLTADSMNPDQF